ncbi:MAG TPA: phytoene desaturase family protein [bacterium]|nr:phytoene desaturase family protein [bacterium]HPJ71120.1 phytoene desaturase family protein [bacterium]HPQ65745.1 phytoene desaturase family protein [bacterium]
MRDKKIVIIGAGPGGLTAAMILARRGFKVTVFEKENTVGGRNAPLRLGGYTFDVGPTFLMMKEVLEEVFEEAGADAGAYLEFRRLEPMYRLQFADRRLEPTTDRERMREEIERVFPGRGSSLDRYLIREKDRFDRLYPCLKIPYSSLCALFSRNLFKAIPHLSLNRKLFSLLKTYFVEDELALAFTFQAKYLGMSPWECPGLFAILCYIEHAFGVYHTMGGLFENSRAMAEVARANGAEIILGTPVRGILLDKRRARGVELESGGSVEADDVVINADFGHAMETFFPPGFLRKYSPAKLQRRRFSCSTFMLYLGLDRLYDLPHHAIFFARNYRRNVDEVFRTKTLSRDISFYVRNASATDSSLAPAGHSAVYVLVPVPNLRSGIDWEREREPFRELVIDMMEQRAGMKNLRGAIREEKVITPADWDKDYNVYIGSVFNLGHNLRNMIYLRPHNRFEECAGCYLVGGGTHPGSGLPTIFESGRISANMISEKYGVAYPRTRERI